jgi:hypothetical protein
MHISNSMSRTPGRRISVVAPLLSLDQSSEDVRCNAGISHDTGMAHLSAKDAIVQALHAHH